MRNTNEQIKKSSQYQALQEQIEQLKQAIKLEKNRDVRARSSSELAKFEKLLQEALNREEDAIPDWIVTGMKLLSDTLMRNRILLKMYPFELNSEFSIVANLKRDCFLDADFENVLFAYGTRPDVLLTVFGLTTSVPPKGAHPFDPNTSSTKMDGEQDQLQSAFRQMFNAFEGIERLTQFSYYPNLTIYPIAVYQRLGSLVPDEEGEEIPD